MNNEGKTGTASQGAVPSIEKENLFFGEKVRIGSHKVLIEQVGGFSILPKDPSAQFIRDEVTKKIGAAWKHGSRDVVRGLTPEQEEVYLPKILGIQTTSDNWNDATMTYWAEFSTNIPADKGLELEIGFEIDPRTKKPEPINLLDYMRWNHAKATKWVAITDDELANKGNYTFFATDVQKLKIEEENEFVFITRAEKAFAKLTTSEDPIDKSKIDWILIVEDGLGGSIKKMTSIQKQIALKKLRDANPKKFISMVNDAHLETKALLNSATEYGILTLAGNSYMFESKVLGSNEKEAIAYLENSNPEYVKDKQLIIEKLKQYTL